MIINTRSSKLKFLVLYYMYMYKFEFGIHRPDIPFDENDQIWPRRSRLSVVCLLSLLYDQKPDIGAI